MRRIFVLALVLGPMAWLWKAVDRAREGARWCDCYDGFCAISLALYNYEAQYGSLPPAYVADAKGRPLYSWRVLILPFIGLDSTYAAFRLDEPWDGPNNIKLLSRLPFPYSCPTRPDRDRAGLTKCLAITGPGTMFPVAVPAKLADMSDREQWMILCAEVANLDVPWTAPIDLDIRTMSRAIDDLRRPGLSSPHPAGVGVAHGRGGPYHLPNTTGRAELAARLGLTARSP